MEPTNKPSVSKRGPVVEFLPDADEIERSPLPRYIRLTLHTMVAAVVVFVLWATFSEVDQIVTAKGKLVNPTQNVVVQPLETALVQEVHVRLGQVVKKGEVLATLDPTFTRADAEQLRVRLRSLENQAQGLQSEIAGRANGNKATDADSLLQAQLSSERSANYQAQLAKLEQNVARLRSTAETNRRDQVTLAMRVKSLREMEAMQEKLVAQNYGARLHLLEAQDKRLEVERDLNLANNREHELKNELAAAEAERNAFDKAWRQKTMEDLLGATRERDALNEQLQKAGKRFELIKLVAPVDGVVLEIAKLSPGSVIKEAEAMFTLVPLGGKLEAEVQIDAMDVGYVKLGDHTEVKLDAFPFQKHGALKASVRMIAEDAFRRDGSNPASPEAYYVSRIDLGNSKLKKLAARERLLPGMTVSAEIVVGKRTVVSYLLWPLTKALDESIREP
jgi:HlyD family secretion protein